jgi:hypothetical protein
MTEAEWLANNEPPEMLQFLGGSASQRKLRLFACACCRRIISILSVQGISSLEVAERFADQQVSNADCFAAHNAAYQEYEASPSPVEVSKPVLAVAWAAIVSRDGYPSKFAEIVAENVCRFGGAWIQGVALTEPQMRERLSHAELIRDIFGNPFRSITFSPEWRTSTAVALAQGMYESRDFGAMPILADALQDAGCESAEVFDHCRGPGPHVRGCWVVDLVLGKE